MKWDTIRQLRRAEHSLDSQIEKASVALSGSDRLSLAMTRGRVIRHPAWHVFLQFARPVSEARNHIICEREYLERQTEHAITSAVNNLKRRVKP